MEKKNRECYNEVLTILNNMEEMYINKIPQKLIDYFKQNSVENYDFNINFSIPFKEQKIKNETLAILAMLNLNYWCESEEEKQELIKQYEENDRKYQEELSIKYSKDIFVKSEKENKIDEINNKESQEMINIEETLLQKIINKIKNFLKRDATK